jgi:hypothetical protein
MIAHLILARFVSVRLATAHPASLLLVAGILGVNHINGPDILTEFFRHVLAREQHLSLLHFASSAGHRCSAGMASPGRRRQVGA